MIKTISASDSTKSLTNMINWGNYTNAEFYYDNNGISTLKASGIATRIPTGSSEYTKAYNLYDVSGNISDWTLAAYTPSNRATGGGYYINLTPLDPQYVFGFDYPTYNSAGNGSRLQLYLK